MCAAPFLFRIMRTQIMIKMFCGTAHIPDAHGGRTWNSTELSEALHLHRTGEGKKDVSGRIHCFREKTCRRKQCDLKQQNHLTPMQNMDTLTEASNPFRSKNTEKKREQRGKR